METIIAKYDPNGDGKMSEEEWRATFPKMKDEEKMLKRENPKKWPPYFGKKGENQQTHFFEHTIFEKNEAPVFENKVVFLYFVFKLNCFCWKHSKTYCIL